MGIHGHIDPAIYDDKKNVIGIIERISCGFVACVMGKGWIGSQPTELTIYPTRQDAEDAVREANRKNNHDAKPQEQPVDKRLALVQDQEKAKKKVWRR
jgi:hypothetical protein